MSDVSETGCLHQHAEGVVITTQIKTGIVFETSRKYRRCSNVIIMSTTTYNHKKPFRLGLKLSIETNANYHRKTLMHSEETEKGGREFASSP